MKSKLRYFQLEESWNAFFSSSERKTIEETYQPFGEGGSGGSILSTTQTKFAFLSGLLGWFKKPEQYKLGRKLTEFIEKYMAEAQNALDVHFYLQNKIEFYYKNRDLHTEALKLSIESCKAQIELSGKAATEFRKPPFGNGSNTSLPVHIGYKQLAIIYDKQGSWKELVGLCEKAKAEGWNGDWDKRIAKGMKKASAV